MQPSSLYERKNARCVFFFFSSRRRHTRLQGDWSSRVLFRSYASTGAGSASHLAGELFNQRAGIDMVHVPYKGGAPALQDLLGERVTSYFAAPPTALPHIEAGKLIPLATTGLTRPAYMPDIPTVAEAGYPGFA